MVRAAREGCKMRADDLRKRAESDRDNSALPTPEEVVDLKRIPHWCAIRWESGKGMTRKSAYLANVLVFDVTGEE